MSVPRTHNSFDFQTPPPETRPHWRLLGNVAFAVALVAVTAIVVWPVFQGAGEIHKLRLACRDLQNTFAATREAAHATERMYAFMFVPETGQYKVECWGNPLPKDAPAAEVPDIAKLPDASDQRIERTLADDVRFMMMHCRPDPEGELIAKLRLAESGDAGKWSQPILFYPDGSTTTGVLVMHDAHGYQIELTCDGSGSARLSEPYKPN